MTHAGDYSAFADTEGAAVRTVPPVNSSAITAAAFAALSVVFLPLAWLFGAIGVLAARRARGEIARTGEGGGTLATLALNVSGATITLVVVIYAGVLLSAAL